MGNRWLESSRDVDDYDRRWVELAQQGAAVHGEADFVTALEPASVMDAGCGTGRVALELARRGIQVVGVDLDPRMLRAARAKATQVGWIEEDLGDVDVRDASGRRRRFDVVVMAGNVMIFLEPGSEGRVVANLAGHLAPGGALVAGFQLNGRLDLAAYDAHCAAAGLVPDGRWATWDRQRWHEGGGYAVSLHRGP